RTIQQLAHAAGMSPWDFAEYPPLTDICLGLLFLAREALPDKDRTQLEHLIDRLQQAQQQRVSDDYTADQNKLLRSWLDHQFGAAGAEAALGDVPFPALSKYQPEVQQLLRAIGQQNITIEDLAGRATAKPEDVWVIVEGQIQLQSSELKERLWKALGLDQGGKSR